MSSSYQLTSYSRLLGLQIMKLLIVNISALFPTIRRSKRSSKRHSPRMRSKLCQVRPILYQTAQLTCPRKQSRNVFSATKINKVEIIDGSFQVSLKKTFIASSKCNRRQLTLLLPVSFYFPAKYPNFETLVSLLTRECSCQAK